MFVAPRVLVFEMSNYSTGPTWPRPVPQHSFQVTCVARFDREIFAKIRDSRKRVPCFNADNYKTQGSCFFFLCLSIERKVLLTNETKGTAGVHFWVAR